MAQERKYSNPRLLSSLEEVAKTRTPIWDISGSGDIRIKLDTDVNGQEWYVIEDNSQRGGSFTGEVQCWAFPHFNGAHDFYSYVPVSFCFKTFASLLEEYPQHTKDARWHYDEKELTERLERDKWQNEQIGSLEGKVLAELQREIDLGMEVYPSTNHDVIVQRLQDEPWGIDRYVFLRYEDGTQREKPSRVPPTPDEDTGHLVNHVIVFFADENRDGGLMVDETDTYETFSELLEDWPDLASKPVWGTTITPERKCYEKAYIEKKERNCARDEKVKSTTPLISNGKLVIVGKTLAEMRHLVDAGQTLYVHTGKQGTIQLHRLREGHYAYELKYLRYGERWFSEETDNHTLDTFLESIKWTDEETSQEMKGYLAQPVWGNVDEQTYHMLLEDEDK
ncbi:MAG TPA: hypothetical protein VHV10_01265 [Ktedonobacteraceae bacterium]|nr:hypothetical protein [Ktedonobacteraceae bacterium]